MNNPTPTIGTMTSRLNIIAAPSNDPCAEGGGHVYDGRTGRCCKCGAYDPYGFHTTR
jgi:hypothetical protein